MIIKIKDNTKEKLETLRTHLRESWDDLIQILIKQVEARNESSNNIKSN